MEISVIDYSLYIALFLFATTLLQIFTNKISFPYTVALLFIGLMSQLFLRFFNIPTSLTLSPEVIYIFLLPILLFEAAMHINIHQFKIQFKTITFLATFGLLLSIFVIGFGLALFANIPFGVALLFGAIISATDPIAVLTLFKTLGAPKRLALIADGESMFNDATGVIAFRIISSFVLVNQTFQSRTIFESAGNFLYVFFGSIVLGVVMGYIVSEVVKYIKSEKILITGIISSLALGSFAIAEHFFHLSGVITTVIAGLVFGNMALGKIREKIVVFVEEYFSYIGFLSLSLVFFFASFNLNLDLFTSNLTLLFIVIFVVLVARAISIYFSVFLTNALPVFRDEPNIPLSWQHILNWGGLRGVIPLVLVYSLPDSFIYKEFMLSFTFATLLFTLFVNGLTIKPLLLRLKLHLPKREEMIISDELELFRIEEKKRKLLLLSLKQFDKKIVEEVRKEIDVHMSHFEKDIVEMSDCDEFLHSIKLEALNIQRETLHRLFEERRFNERVLYEFESELDLQQDALEYPGLYKNQAVNEKGEINHKRSFRKKLLNFRRMVAKNKILSRLLRVSEKDIVLERYTLLRARLFSSYEVLDYLDRLDSIFAKHGQIIKAVSVVKEIQGDYIRRNLYEASKIEEKYKEYTMAYQKKIILRQVDFV